MRRGLLPLIALAVVSTMVVPTAVRAFHVTVHFTVRANPGDASHSGQTAEGSFSFDTSIIPTGGGTVTNPRISGLSLLWDGHAWSTADAGASSLEFDSSGKLTGWVIGGKPGGFATVNPGVPDFSASGITGSTSAGRWAYTTQATFYALVYSGDILEWSVGGAGEPAVPLRVTASPASR